MQSNIIKRTKNTIVIKSLKGLHHSHEPADPTHILNKFIGFLKDDILCKDIAIHITKFGRLTPKIKKGGRPVRNPKTLETSSMPEIATITLTRRHVRTSKKKRYTELQLSKMFLENEAKTGINFDPKFITSLTQAFFNSIREVGTNPNVRLEIRGLGTFSSKIVEEALSRNPKNEEIVIVSEHIKPHFKISSTLKKDLYTALTSIE